MKALALMVACCLLVAMYFIATSDVARHLGYLGLPVAAVGVAIPFFQRSKAWECLGLIAMATGVTAVAAWVGPILFA